MCIGTDESACAELDPAEIAHDGDSSICNLTRLDCLEDGAARSAAGLSVIARALAVGTRPEHHRIGDVARLVVLLLYGCEPCAHLLLVLCVNGIGEKARALNLI